MKLLSHALFLPVGTALLLSLGGLPNGVSATSAAGASLDFKSEELVSRSFPPNLNWLHFGEPGFDSHFYGTFAVGQWVEYVLQIPEAGTYKLTVQAFAGNSSAKVQAFVDGVKQGEAQDLFAASRSPRTLDFGNCTFLKAGKAILRLQVEGKNSQSQGYAMEFNAIDLTSDEGFRLVAPNGACFEEGNPVLQWTSLGKDVNYTVYLDDAPQSPTKKTFLEVKNPGAGEHHWYVVAEGPKKEKQRSNCFRFTAGPPAPYPDRDYSDNFDAGDLSNYVNHGVASADSTDGKKSLAGAPNSSAYVKNVSLGVSEGEVSTMVTLDDATSSASAGFTDADGTCIRATIDAASGTLNLERIVKSYSILAITPKAYQLPAWKESRTQDGAYLWQIASSPAALKPGVAYQLKLAWSRRSCAVMATLMDVDGGNLVTLRDLSDVNLPDHPMLAVNQGKAHFQQLAYRRINRKAYPWDIDTNQIVMRPGPPGSWDSRGVLNNAVIVKGNHWYMVYRGNPIPAPPNGGPDSELGVATSTDGVHWTKDEHNPIIKKIPGRDSEEDPDLLQPAGTNLYFLERYSTKSPVHELMASSEDGIHYSEPWDLPVKGKIGGMIDTHNEQQIPEFAFNGQKYRYLAAIEEGGIYLSNDLHDWVKMGTADYTGKPDRWCDGHECAGDIFVDADHNLRVETQAGTKVNGKDRISGNRLCTNVEDILSGSDPTKVLSRGDLPYLPDYYGDAPTGDLNEATFTNGSVFPGQTIIHDGWLWHYYGGNNTITGLIKAPYHPVFVYRNLRLLPSGNSKNKSVEVTIRNEGSLAGKTAVNLLLDGKVSATKPVTLGRDEETKVSFPISAPQGQHWIGIDDLTIGETTFSE